MSDTTLRNLIDRINSDESFRAALMSDPDNALQGYQLTPAEVVALGTNDEDALRRLAGDVTGFGGGSNGPLNPTVYSTIVFNPRTILTGPSYATPCGTHGTVNHIPC